MRRRYRRYRRKVVDFDIVVGRMSEVVELVRRRLKEGWTLDGETFYYDGTAYAAQTMVLYAPEPPEPEPEYTPGEPSIPPPMRKQ